MVATKRTRNEITLVPVNKTEPAGPAKPSRPTELRNGVPLLPHRETREPLTTEFVKGLLDEQDAHGCALIDLADVRD